MKPLLIYDGDCGFCRRSADWLLSIDWRRVIDIRPVFRKRLLDPRGRATAPSLPEILVSPECRAHDTPCVPEVIEPLSPVEEVYEALVLGTGDYARKNGFMKGDESLSGDDVREGLTAIVSVKLEDPQFEGQTKGKLGSPEMAGAVVMRAGWSSTAVSLWQGRSKPSARHKKQPAPEHKPLTCPHTAPTAPYVSSPPKRRPWRPSTSPRPDDTAP